MQTLDLGDLSICGEAVTLPAHGGTYWIRYARYTIENRGKKPVDVEVRAIDVVDKNGTHTPMKVDRVEWGFSGPTTRTIAIAPGATKQATIIAGGSVAGFRYKTEYHHEVTFRADQLEGTVRASRLYFRKPRPLRRW